MWGFFLSRKDFYEFLASSDSLSGFEKWELVRRLSRDVMPTDRADIRMDRADFLPARVFPQ